MNTKEWWRTSPRYIKAMLIIEVIAGSIVIAAAYTFKGQWRFLDTLAITSGGILVALAIAFVILYKLDKEGQ